MKNSEEIPVLFKRGTDQLAAAPDAHLGEELLKGVLDGALRDFHPGRYLLVRQALNQEAEHLRLAAVQGAPLHMVSPGVYGNRRRRFLGNLSDNRSQLRRRSVVVCGKPNIRHERFSVIPVPAA